MKSNNLINIGPRIRKERRSLGLSQSNFSKNLGLDIVGIMCIPPFDEDPIKYFSQMSVLNDKVNLTELSMGMSSDYIKAIEFNSTYLRIGSNIFGQRN